MTRDSKGDAPLEREIKLALDDVPGCLARLQELGAVEVEERRFEDNRLFDDPAQSHAARDCILRLRTKGRPGEDPGPGILTFKGPARIDEGARVREELETRVEDAVMLADILGRMGLVPTFRYQKSRRYLELDGASLALDDTPLGGFLEIEGPQDVIDRLAGELGCGRDDYVTESYPALWRAAGNEGDMLWPEGEADR
ncbi:MAG: class IV adenylate cyclase [Acidobacteriota bacterium]